MPEKTSRNDEIVRRYKRGDTLQSIADDFGLTKERIRQIAVSKYGLPARGYGRVGIHLVIEGMKHVRDGLTFEQAAARVGINEFTLWKKAVRLGLHAPVPVVQQAWSASEIRTLSNLYRILSASKIAEKLSRNRNEVIGKARRLGL
jgi:hypothetical protein